MNVNMGGVETNGGGCDAMRMAPVFVHTLIALPLAWFAGSSPAKTEIPVDLELVLAVNSSASEDTREFEL